MNSEKKFCLKCSKKLVAIHDERINGNKTKFDWNSRKYHKKCWLIIKKEEEFKEQLKRYENYSECMEIYSNMLKK